MIKNDTWEFIKQLPISLVRTTLALKTISPFPAALRKYSLVDVRNTRGRRGGV